MSEKDDKLFILDRAPDGNRCVRIRDGVAEFGVLRQPQGDDTSSGASELVKLKPHGGGCQAYDVETVWSRSGDGAHDGPAHVTSPEYRTGWDTVFGKRAPINEVN